MSLEILKCVWPRFVGMLLAWGLAFALLDLWRGPLTFDTFTILVLGVGAAGALFGMLHSETRRRKKRSHKP